MVAATDSFVIMHDSIDQPPVLVLALGNILIEDEGIGIAALESLQQSYHIPQQVELLDGGTSGMALLDDLRNRKKLIVLDAINNGQPPGTMVVLKNDEVPAFFRSKVSPHQLALSDVLATLALTGDKTTDITVIGAVPASFATRIGLSPAVAVQLKPIVESVVTELESAGYKLEPVNDKQADTEYSRDVMYSLNDAGGVEI